VRWALRCLWCWVSPLWVLVVFLDGCWCVLVVWVGVCRSSYMWFAPPTPRPHTWWWLVMPRPRPPPRTRSGWWLVWGLTHRRPHRRKPAPTLGGLTWGVLLFCIELAHTPPGGCFVFALVWWRLVVCCWSVPTLGFQYWCSSFVGGVSGRFYRGVVGWVFWWLSVRTPPHPPFVKSRAPACAFGVVFVFGGCCGCCSSSRLCSTSRAPTRPRHSCLFVPPTTPTHTRHSFSHVPWGSGGL